MQIEETGRFFQDDRKKIKARISRYERLLKSKNHRDGAGKRFLLGPLYLLMGDVEGAAKSYAWYRRKFPDDMPEAFNHLCWVVTLLRTDQIKTAKEKMRELIFSNLYIIPMLLKEPIKEYKFRHSSNWHEKTYVSEGPFREIFALVGEAELDWIREVWRSKAMQAAVDSYIEIQIKLTDLRPGPERTRLVEESIRISTGKEFSFSKLKNIFC